MFYLRQLLYRVSAPNAVLFPLLYPAWHNAMPLYAGRRLLIQIAGSGAVTQDIPFGHSYWMTEVGSRWQWIQTPYIDNDVHCCSGASLVAAFIFTLHDCFIQGSADASDLAPCKNQTFSLKVSFLIKQQKPYFSVRFRMWIYVDIFLIRSAYVWFSQWQPVTMI